MLYISTSCGVAEVIGPLPEVIQNYTVYGCGVSSNSYMIEATKSFVGAVTTRAADEVIRAKGVLPAH
jgi:ABC-type molybdate transport system substrate-binding protein